MNNFEFINYFPTPEENYFMGIATVRIYGKIVLRYKVVKKKDGTGYFVAASNYKLPVNDDGSYKYVDAFLLDSTMENDELRAFIRVNVNNAISPQENKQLEVNQGSQQQQAQEVYNQPDLDTCPF